MNLKIRLTILAAVFIVAAVTVFGVQKTCGKPRSRTSDRQFIARETMEHRNKLLNQDVTEKSVLSDQDVIEAAFMQLSDGLIAGVTSEIDQQTAVAVRILVEALKWKDNPARKLVLQEVETLVYTYIRISDGHADYSAHELPPQLWKILKIYAQQAPEAVKAIRNLNPKSQLVKLIDEL